MGLKSLFKKSESLLSIDIGSSAIKLIEMDISGAKPKLINIGMAPLTGEIFTNNSITNVTRVSEVVTELVESNGSSEKRVVTAMPAPSVFTKRIKMPKMDWAELSSNVQFEAGNSIPHNINAVKLDFHVLGESQKGQLDVLVVAVKNEIVDSYLDSFGMSGLNVAVVDVDYFSLQNIFEMAYPHLFDKTVALVNVGARFSAVNICKAGQTLFTGDITMGGKVFTEALSEGLEVSFDEAEKLKKNPDKGHPQYRAVEAVLEGAVDHVASELNRQLSFFWNASGSDENIERIFLSGGASLTHGLVEAMQEKTGLPCERLDPFKEFEPSDAVDADSMKTFAPFMAIAAGMAMRQPGDKIRPDLD